MKNELELTNSNLLCDDFSGFINFGSVKPVYDPATQSKPTNTTDIVQSKPKMFGSINVGVKTIPTSPNLQVNSESVRPVLVQSVQGNDVVVTTSSTKDGIGVSPRQGSVLVNNKETAEEPKKTDIVDIKKDNTVKPDGIKETVSINKQESKLSDEEKSGYVLGMKPVVLYSIVGVLLVGGSYAAYKLLKK